MPIKPIPGWNNLWMWRVHDARELAMNNRFSTVLGSVWLLLAVFAAAVQAQESTWPRMLALASGSVTVYPLQVDHKEGDLVRFRAALAYRPTAQSEPVFGVAWFQSRVRIDHAKGMVQPLGLTVTETRFPEGTDNVQPELAEALAQQSADWNLELPLTQFNSELEASEQEARTVQSLNMAPPAIIYRDHPALLVTFDGEPVLRSIESSPYQAVVNTPYPLIFDGRAYHLSAAKGVWYRADRATGPYRFDASPPADIVTMVEAASQLEEQPAATQIVTAANAPEIVVATTPTELIVTDGPAAFVPLVDDLLVLNNSDDDVFMHISSQQFYIVLAGRWYQSPSLNGPWSFRRADELPAAFASIPQNSDQADSRVYVAGTRESREAVLDAQIPQTAAVDRGTADLDVIYDGDPRFLPVEGTDELAYADNTGSTVLQSDRQYYLVEDGVWYVSSSPNGPWVVSDYRPEEVASISPRSPVYNVKYVYIYDSTPEVVYVGYTPGYTGSYVYYDTIVYGTGWYYRPWISPRYYYPRYSTWGYSVGYDPWYGWNFGLSWAWGPFFPGYYSGGFWHHHWSWYNPRCSRWGPGGYRPRLYDRHAHGWGDRDYRGYKHGYRDGNRYGSGGYDQGGYGRRGPGRDGRGYDSPLTGAGDTFVRSRNLYRDRAQRARVTEPGDRIARYRTGTAALNFAANPDNPALRQRNLNRESRGGFRSSKPGRNQTGPVTASDLRVKAQVRDTYREADRGRGFAAGKGNELRRVKPLPQQNRSRGREPVVADTVSRSSAAGRYIGRNGDDRGSGRRPEYIASARSGSLSPQQPSRASAQPYAPAGRAAYAPSRQDYSRPGRGSPAAQPAEPRWRPALPDAARQSRSPQSAVPPTSGVRRSYTQRQVPQPVARQASAPRQVAQQRGTTRNSPQFSTATPGSSKSRQQQSASPRSDGSGRGRQERGRGDGGRFKRQD